MATLAPPAHWLGIPQTKMLYMLKYYNNFNHKTNHILFSRCRFSFLLVLFKSHAEKRQSSEPFIYHKSDHKALLLL